MSENRIVEFFKLIETCRSPKRADRSAGGYLPSRAMRYCDALTSGTGYGYWLFPPISFRLLWDGEQIFWSLDESDDWLPVSGTDSGAVQFPDFADVFDKAAPDYLAGFSPPFLTALPEVGGVQIWTGLLARTRPGWSLNVRRPVNLPVMPNLDAWEGIVETDVWFGPLFNNFRITRTDSPVIFRAGVPFLQVQPIPQIAYSDEALANFKCLEADDLKAEDWSNLSQILLPSVNLEARQGDYAVRVRKRRTCPVSHDQLMPSTAKPDKTSS